MAFEDNNQDAASGPSSPNDTSNAMDFTTTPNITSPQPKKLHANSELNLNNSESMPNEERAQLMFEKHASTSQNEVQKLLKTPVEQLNSKYRAVEYALECAESTAEEQVLPNRVSILLPQHEDYRGALSSLDQMTPGWNNAEQVPRTESTIDRLKLSFAKNDQTVTEIVKRDKRMGVITVRKQKGLSKFENNGDFNESIKEASRSSKFNYGGEMNLSRRDNQGINFCSNERSVIRQNINHEGMGNNTFYDNFQYCENPRFCDDSANLLSIHIQQLASGESMYDSPELGVAYDLHGEDCTAMMDQQRSISHHGPIQRSITGKQGEGAGFSKMNMNHGTLANVSKNYQCVMDHRTYEYPVSTSLPMPEEPTVVLSKHRGIMGLPEHAGAIASYFSERSGARSYSISEQRAAMCLPISEQACALTVSISEQVGAISLPVSEPAGAFSLPNISEHSYYCNNTNDTLPHFQTLMARSIDSTSILKSIIGISTANEGQNLFSSGVEHFGQNYPTMFNQNHNGFNHNGNICHDYMPGNPDLSTSTNSNRHHFKKAPQKERYGEWTNMFDSINKERNASKTDLHQKIYRQTYKVETFADFIVKISEDSSDFSDQKLSKGKKKKEVRPYPYMPKNSQLSHNENKGAASKFKNQLWKAMPIHETQYENNRTKELQQDDDGFGQNYNRYYEIFPSDMSQKKREDDLTTKIYSGILQKPKRKKKTQYGQSSQDTHRCGRNFSLFSDDSEDQDTCSICKERLGNEEVTIMADWQKYSVWGGYANEEQDQEEEQEKEEGVEVEMAVEMVVEAEENETTFDYDELAILYEGRNILDLMFNITNPSWVLRMTALPRYNLIMFIDNRSQYHRLSEYGENEEHFSSCPLCSFGRPTAE